MKKTWIEITGWIENVIVTRLVAKKVGPVMKWVFKTPIFFYKLGLGPLVGGQILLLTTTGRHTGKARVTPLEYSYLPEKDAYFVMTGWGGRSDWYRNACACPTIKIQVGKHSFTGRVKPAASSDVVQVMVNVMKVYPKAVRTWSKFSGIPYDGTQESLDRIASAFPSLLIYPVRQETRQ